MFNTGKHGARGTTRATTAAVTGSNNTITKPRRSGGSLWKLAECCDSDDCLLPLHPR